MKRGILRVLVAALFLYGVWIGLRRGGEDFRVFHYAAKLVLSGHGDRIYAESPDRFLYSPGIAWVMAPFGFLSWQAGFVIWAGLKLIALLALVRSLVRRYGETATLLAVAFFARPFLIEIRYGQVNLFILAASWLFLDAFLDAGSSANRLDTGAVSAGTATVTKIFPGVVVGVPFFRIFFAKGEERKRALLLTGLAAFTILILTVVPALTEGLRNTLQLQVKWFHALRAKGFATDTLNQSLGAVLHHGFADEIYYSNTLGPLQKGMKGLGWVSARHIPGISTAILLMLLSGLTLLAAVVARRKDPRLVPLLVAGLILPSHLVWKPYFILGIPLVASLLGNLPRTKAWTLVMITLFLVINATSLDLIGAQPTAWFEACGGLLWAYLALMVINVWCLRRMPSSSPEQASAPVSERASP